MARVKRNAKASLRLLGHSVERPPAKPTVATLETFPNRSPQRDYLIEFTTSDFTSLCPVTGQPDFAKLCISYVPDKLCLETKALKFYLASYHNTRSFNEEIVNRVLDHLVEACAPRSMRVQGTFSARGGISVSVTAEYPDSPLL
jgi:7-cyano-7-deazaguanine reductase